MENKTLIKKMDEIMYYFGSLPCKDEILLKKIDYIENKFNPKEIPIENAFNLTKQIYFLKNGFSIDKKSEIEQVEHYYKFLKNYNFDELVDFLKTKDLNLINKNLGLKKEKNKLEQTINYKKIDSLKKLKFKLSSEEYVKKIINNNLFMILFNDYLTDNSITDRKKAIFISFCFASFINLKKVGFSDFENVLEITGKWLHNKYDDNFKLSFLNLFFDKIIEYNVKNLNQKNINYHFDAVINYAIDSNVSKTLFLNFLKNKENNLINSSNLLSQDNILYINSVFEKFYLNTNILYDKPISKKSFKI